MILVGGLRSGKTPTRALPGDSSSASRAANFPLNTRRLRGSAELPNLAARVQATNCFGLTIKPDRLHQIRSVRRPDSTYASLANCVYEIRGAEALMKRESIRVLDTTTRSIEEIATTIVQHAKLVRHIFAAVCSGS